MTDLAVLHGASVYYNEIFYDDIMVQRDDGEYAIVSRDTFEHLYFRLWLDQAALKEDCIQYVIYKKSKPLQTYPEWFIEAVYEGIIYDMMSAEFYDDKNTEIPMGHASVILRNFKGEFKHISLELFERYYDPNPELGGWL